MKQALVFFISLYQALVSPFLHHFGIGGCRYPVSCSEYGKQVIKRYGVVKGTALALKRLSTCHPFTRYSLQ